MSKIKITLADAKAELRDAATGPGSQHWGYAPAVMALLNNHDELLSILGEAKAALEEAHKRADAAEQREDHLKSAVDVLARRVKELRAKEMLAVRRARS